MDTPICDFVTAYAASDALRLHMPGHKGRDLLGVEHLDITEIAGADVLYHAKGIIRRSEENAAALFGAERTLYSAEGSSLAIRAMLYLAVLHGKEQGRRPLVLAGRNAHRAFLSAAALLDLDVAWLRGKSLLSCAPTPEELDAALAALEETPAAVYVTSPDYLGHMADVAGLSAVCRARGVLLLVDNAHGAYLNFLPRSAHPMALGADACCDSAHKTLPVLTGGAYLHIAHSAPALFREQAERAMALFASTSPSYLILQSLDRANACLAEGYRERLARFIPQADALKARLEALGWDLAGEEPLKLTLAPKSWGYRGEELAEYLLERGMVCEFADPDYLVLMLTPELGEEALTRIGDALADMDRRPPVTKQPPRLPVPRRALSIREALLAPSEELPLEECAGRILADPAVSCPPAVPVLVCGEVIDGDAIACLRYYGMDSCRVLTK